MKSALILYPHQLFPLDQLPKVEAVLLVEEPLYFGIDRKHPIKLHKQKLILHRASMRRYVEEVLWPAGLEVDYINLDGLMTSEDIFERARKYEQLYLFDPVDDVLTKRLLQARREDDSVPAFEFLSSPNFYLKNQEIQQYFASSSKLLFADFYQWQRERFNILIGEDYKPSGGKWIFENEKPELVAKDTQLPSFEAFGSNKYVDEAIKYVEEHFPNNFGTTDFVWPTSHAEAAAWLKDFVENRLDNFGPYEDAIDSKAIWLYHSALSSSLNIGLLNPQQVVEAALQRHSKKPVKLESLEMFIRQILGWREFIHAQYVTQHVPMRSANMFGHKRKMTKDWYTGNLGLPPFDSMVRKLHKHAYVPSTERLMVAGNLMLLCEIDPNDIYRWFGELFIDSYDWVMVPNVYGMTQFVDSGSIVTKPYISASNYITQTSDYDRGEWADIWDGLFWRFVEKNKTKLKSNPNMRAVIQRLERLDPDRRRIIGYRADDFLNKYTT